MDVSYIKPVQNSFHILKEADYCKVMGFFLLYKHKNEKVLVDIAPRSSDMIKISNLGTGDFYEFN